MDANRRQTKEQEQCFVGNDVLACYPTAGSRFMQNGYGKVSRLRQGSNLRASKELTTFTLAQLIWNKNYPDFTNNGGYIDIYLFQQDSDKLVQTWKNVENAQGRISFMPQDSWWEGREQADNFDGVSIDWPFYFVITHAGKGLTGTRDRLATWYGVQTALPSDIAASRSSASVASSSASAESAASASLSSLMATATATSLSSMVTPAPSALPSSDASILSQFATNLTSRLQSSLRKSNATGTQTLQGTATTTLPDGNVITASATAQANGQVPGQDEGSALPRYAIALIVVFGLLSLSAIIVGIYFCLSAARRRRMGVRQGAYENASQVGSNTPMIGAFDDRTNQDDIVSHDPPRSPAMRDLGRSTAIDMNGASSSAAHERSSGEGLTSSEVWRIANAFRSALRKPQFNPLARVSVSQSDEHTMHNEGPSQAAAENEEPGADQSLIDESREWPAQALLREELEGEGRQLRSVEERKKPELHE